MRKFVVGIVSLVCLAAVLAVVPLWGLKGDVSKNTGARIHPPAFSYPDVAPREYSRHQVISAYGNLPLAFEPNQGQTNSQVKFLTRGVGYELFLTPQESVFVLGTGSAGHARSTEKAAVLRMNLKGANQHPVLIGREELPGNSNYLSGRDPKNWHTNVPNYRVVAEQQAYPGIDLVYYGN